MTDMKKTMITKDNMESIYSEFSLTELEHKLEYVKYLTTEYGSDLTQEIAIIESLIKSKTL